MRDLRYALRQLARSPGFTAVALLTLALGIGACTAIFSVVSSVLLRPLPYPQSERLVVVKETLLPRFPEFAVSPGHYFDWKEQATSFESLTAAQQVDGIPGRAGAYALTGMGSPVRVSAARLTANAFSTLGVHAALGRDFSAEEDVPGRERVAVLSHGFWVRQFGGRPEVLYRTVQLNGQPFTIVGVMPKGFALDQPADIFTPAAFTTAERQNRGGMHVFDVFGRLKPGVTIEQARGELALIADRLARQYPDSSTGWGIKLTPMLEAKVSDVRPVLLSLLGAVGLLLLIACANVSNLLLARATARSKEIAIRASLGASRGRIVRQLLTESLLLGLLGGGLGVLVAHWGGSLLVALAPEGLPRVTEIGIDAGVLGFALALAVVTGVGFGLAPALRATRGDLSQALKESGRGASDGSRHGRLRGALVIAEVAIALVLLVGAGLLIRSFARLQGVHPGFQPAGALTVSLSLPEQKYGTGPQQIAFADQAIARMAALPGVQAVGAAAALPFSGDVINVIAFKIAGRPVDKDLPITSAFQATPGYFEAMGIPLRRGRLFDGHDTANTPGIVLVNETMARKFFAGDDPIGKRIAAVTGGPDDWREIVGVVGDVKPDKLDGDVSAQAYAPFAQAPWASLTFVVRTAGAVPGLTTAIANAIYAVDKDQPIAKIRPLDQLVARSIVRQRFAMFLFAVFSGAALLLAAIGIYGVMAYAVGQRTGEIAIRMALGAQTGDVLRLLLLQGGRLVALGLAAGLAGALLLTRVLASMLFGVSATDALTFAAVATLLAVFSAAACLLPARRATRVNPMTALRGA
jgi:putative ABC transport system permease protein